MRTGPVLLLMAFAAAYQMAAVPLYRLGSAAPDVVFLAGAYLAFFSPTLQLMIVAGGFSLALDMVSLDPPFTTAAGLLPALYVLGRFRRSFLAESPLLRWLAIFPAALLSLEIRRGYLLAFEPEGGLGFHASLASALYTTCAGLVIHGILDGYRHHLGWVRDRHFSMRR